MNGKLGCSGAASCFAHDSDICRDCPKYHACADESLSALGKIHGLANVSGLLIRHEAARIALGKKPAPIVSLATPAQLNRRLARQTDLTGANEGANNYQGAMAEELDRAEEDIAEAEARHIDRLVMDTDGIEPHLVEAKLDELAERRQEREQREELEKERNRPIQERAAKMLREQFPSRVGRGFVNLAPNDDTTQIQSESDGDGPESPEMMRLMDELEAESAIKFEPVATIDLLTVAVSTLQPAQPKPLSAQAVPKIAEDLSTVASATRYPTLPMDTAVASHDQLVTRSIELASQYRKKKNYWAVRDEFIHVSLALNQYGLLAPVFRDQPRIPFLKKDRDASHDQLLIDQIVIDCHWLHARGEQVVPVWPELQPMFDLSKSFDCSVIASSIGAKGWSSDFKVDELFSLPPRLQVQLVQLRSDLKKENYRIYVTGNLDYDYANRKGTRSKPLLSPIRSMVYTWADGNHRIRGHEEMHVSLWLARELLDSNASNADLAELAALRCGVKPLNPRTASGKLATLDTALVKAGLVAGRSAGV